MSTSKKGNTKSTKKHLKVTKALCASFSLCDLRVSVLGRFFLRRHRNARDLHVDREERAAGGEVECLPVVAAERHVGRRRLTVDDTAELLSGFVHDVEAAAAAGIDVTLRVHLHA